MSRPPVFLTFYLLKRYIEKYEKKDINEFIYPIFIMEHLQIFNGGLSILAESVRSETLIYLQDKTGI